MIDRDRVTHVRAVLRDGPERAEYVEDLSSYETAPAIEGTEYQWTEGNYACDCNRRLFLSRVIPGFVDPGKCGRDVVLESLVVTMGDRRTVRLVG